MTIVLFVLACALTGMAVARSWQAYERASVTTNS